MTEIRWHGRGGQGAKTAALLLADVAFSTGMYVQGFPEYGPERMGAPITAYNRLDDKPILIHSNIYEPDIVVVVDWTLIESVDVTQGIKPGGAVIVNAAGSGDRIRTMLGGFAGDIYSIDASAISQKFLGMNLPNTPLLAAAVKVAGLMDENSFFENMRLSFAHKFASKPEVIEGNIKAIQAAWQEVVKI
jgi:pyruvate ferredoxin oxidoreductase gamma subunit